MENKLGYRWLKSKWQPCLNGAMWNIWKIISIQSKTSLNWTFFCQPSGPLLNRGSIVIKNAFYGELTKTCLVLRLSRLAYKHTLESKTKNPSNSDSANWPVRPAVTGFFVLLLLSSAVYFLNARFPTQKIPPWEWKKSTRLVTNKLGTFLLNPLLLLWNCFKHRKNLFNTTCSWWN